MTAQEIQAYVAAGSVLLQAGVATATQVRAMITLLHPNVSEIELNVILSSVVSDDERRATLARLDQQQARADESKR